MSISSLQLAPAVIEPVDVNFGEWLPDKPELNNPGAVEALNVIPADGGYVPFCSHVPDTVNGILPDPARGAIAVQSPDDVVQIYAGTINGVYSRFGGGFTSIYSGLSLASNAWKFIRVNEQMVMVHPEHVPLRSPVFTNTPAVVVGGSPPTAACGAQVGDFLMLGDLLVDPDDPSPGPFPNRVRWGGQNNIDANWDSSIATQADFQDLPAEGGPVRGIMGREVGTIFQERMIHRATYVNLPSVFNIEMVEDKRGLIARDALVDIGAYAFFIAEDGFFVWNGTNATPIGDSKVNRYFFKRLNYANRSRIVGAVDFKNGCVMWAFPTDSSGELKEVIIYSYREGKWAHSIQTIEWLMSSAGSNITAEDLTMPFESYTISFDDISYRLGGRTALAAFNAAHAYGLYAGPAMAATLDTSEASGPHGTRLWVTDARPFVDLIAPVATMQVARRDQMIGEPPTFGDAVAQEIDGRCPIVEDGRYLRFRVNIPAGAIWQHAMGVTISRKEGGEF